MAQAFHPFSTYEVRLDASTNTVHSTGLSGGQAGRPSTASPAMLLRAVMADELARC
jgi:hypothetical protein